MPTSTSWTLLIDQVRYPEAERFYREGAEFCREHDLTTWGLCLGGALASILLHAGDWQALEDLAAEPLAGDRASPINRITFLVPLGIARARRGLPGWSELLEEAHASAAALDEPEWVVLTTSAPRPRRSGCAATSTPPSGSSTTWPRSPRPAPASGRWPRC